MASRNRRWTLCGSPFYGSPRNAPDTTGTQPKAGGVAHELTPQTLNQLKSMNIDTNKGVTLSNDITVKDIFGNTKNYKKGESIFIYQDTKTGKAIVKDGNYGILQGGQVSKVEQAGKKWGDFASELAQTEEVVKGKISQAEETKRVEAHNKATQEYNDYVRELTSGTPLNMSQRYAELTPNQRLKFEELKRNVDRLKKEYYVDKTKFSQYQEPGGENYREIVLKHPDYKVEPEAHHFDDSATWLRVNDRTTSNNKKVLFIEEVQKNRNLDKSQGHPWAKGKYIEVDLKRALKEAVEKDYDYLSWTTGEQQANRYDLSKQVDRINYEKVGNNYDVTIFPKGSEPSIQRTLTSQELPNFLGKDVAQKIINNEGKSNKGLSGRNDYILDPKDLKIGGEWAKNLYDRQIPSILKDLTRGEVGEIKIRNYRELKNGKVPINEKSQPALKITPEVKARILGQPKGGGNLTTKKHLTKISDLIK
jgi:hypothetical protein